MKSNSAERHIRKMRLLDIVKSEKTKGINANHLIQSNSIVMKVSSKTIVDYINELEVANRLIFKSDGNIYSQ